mmetsp:Transcript_6887/g.7913  ORF Transcript_6887/g.7913 Transcript_6887/m.7913 type:complete len:114 (+) Transcript_6887:259-600(+)
MGKPPTRTVPCHQQERLFRFFKDGVRYQITEDQIPLEMKKRKEEINSRWPGPKILIVGLVPKDGVPTKGFCRGLGVTVPKGTRMICFHDRPRDGNEIVETEQKKSSIPFASSA